MKLAVDMLLATADDGPPAQWLQWDGLVSGSVIELSDSVRCSEVGSSGLSACWFYCACNSLKPNSITLSGSKLVVDQLRSR